MCQEETGIKKTDAEKIYEAMRYNIASTLLSGKTYVLPEVFSVKMVEYTSKNHYHPTTKEFIPGTVRKTLRITPSYVLKELMKKVTKPIK